jgi:hypothetical protein
MAGKVDSWLRQPLLAERAAAENRWARWLLLGIWIAVTILLAVKHVPWRDEGRAWSLMLMGKSWPDMFRTVQGEGHPYLWYVLLRAGWGVFGSPEVLRVTGLVIGMAACALLILKGPFRIGMLALLVFSMHLGFEFTVLARNYGISALIMLVIAASWPRIRDNIWLGVLLLLLCNTNVPSVFVAGSFAFYRMLELWQETRHLKAAEWRRWLLNVALLLVGTFLCFIAVYPPANDAASATGSAPLTIPNLLGALFTAERSFMSIGLGGASLFGSLIVLFSLLLFLDRPKALATAVLALVTLKLFFFFVYPGFYRHSSLFFIFMIGLAWIEAGKGWVREWKTEDVRPALLLGTTAFTVLMAAQTGRYLADPITNLVQNRPYSHAVDLAQIMSRPELRGSMLMIDPDSMGESVVYQTGRPYWLIRRDRLATLTPFSSAGDKRLTLDRLLQQAEAVKVKTGRPVVIALALDLGKTRSGAYDMMYRDYTLLTPDSVDRFKVATRKVASLRHASGDENYDVYVYPR